MRSGGVTRLLTMGVPDDAPLQLEAVSADASHVVFSTEASLVDEDTDGLVDIYDRVGDETRLVSTGPGDTGSFDAEFDALSSDGSRVVFSSEEQLTDEDDDGGGRRLRPRRPEAPRWCPSTRTTRRPAPAPPTRSSRAPRPTRRSSPSRWHDQLSDDDADAVYDLYVRSGDDVSLVTGVPGDVSTAILYQALDISTDGSRVLFVTTEKLVDADVDAVEDAYLYDAGALHLVSAGTVQPVFTEVWNPTLGAVVFGASDALVPEDTDTDYDLYVYRGDGPLSLVTSTTTGVISSLGGNFVSADGSRVVFESVTPLTPGETEDGAADLYLWSPGAEPRLLTGGTAEEDASSWTPRPTPHASSSAPSRRCSPPTPTPSATSTRPPPRGSARSRGATPTRTLSSAGRPPTGAWCSGRRPSRCSPWTPTRPTTSTSPASRPRGTSRRRPSPGNPAAGQTLTCNPGTWSDAESFAYRWNRDGAPIPGAASATYVVPAGDAGHCADVHGDGHRRRRLDGGDERAR